MAELDSIGLLELSSVATGYLAQDAMLKAAIDAIGRLAARSPDLGDFLDEASSIIEATTHDGGFALAHYRLAGAFAATVRAIKARRPECRVEVLIPDFQGHEAPLPHPDDGERLAHHVDHLGRRHPPPVDELRHDPAPLHLGRDFPLAVGDFLPLRFEPCLRGLLR